MSTPFCPYVGLAPFELDHSEYYFGRQLDARTLADNALAARIMVLFGATGTGKSSLINVGLPRELGAREQDWQPLQRTRLVIHRNWQSEVFYEEMKASVRAAIGVGPHTDPGREASLMDMLRDWRVDNRPVLILILDQFEEYFLYRREADTAPFVAALGELVRAEDLNVNILISIRQDRLHHLDYMRVMLPEVLDNTMNLEPLNDACILEAIREPVRVYNHHHGSTRPASVDDGFVATLVTQLKDARVFDGRGSAATDADHTVELPYLQLALEKLWAQATQGDGPIHLDASLLAENPVRKVVGDHVARVMADLTAVEQAICARIFDRLVTRSGAKFAMSVADLSVFAETSEVTMELVLKRLTTQDARILRMVSVPGQAATFEVFHDVLGAHVLAWMQCYEAAQSNLTTHNRLQQEAADAGRKALRQRRIAMAMSLVVVIAVAFGAVALQQSRRATSAKVKAEARAIWAAMPQWSVGEDIDESELRTAWTLATADVEVKDAFVGHLRHDKNAIVRLGVRPSPFARALGLVWQPSTIAIANEVVGSIDGNSGSMVGLFGDAALARGVSALRDQLDKGAFDHAKGLLLKRVEAANASDLNKLSLDMHSQLVYFLATVLDAMEVDLQPKLARDARRKLNEALPALLDKLGKTPPDWQVSQVARVTYSSQAYLEPPVREMAARRLGARLLAKQQHWVVPEIARALGESAQGTGASMHWSLLPLLFDALHQLSPPPSRHGEGLDDREEIRYRPAKRISLVSAVEALSAQPPPASVAAGVRQRILRALREATTPEARTLVARAALPVLARLKRENVDAALNHVLEILYPETDAGRRKLLADAMAPRQEGRPWTPPLSCATLINAPSSAHAPAPADAGAVEARANLVAARMRLLALIAPRCDAAERFGMLGLLLDSIEREKDPLASEGLARAVAAIAGATRGALLTRAVEVTKLRLSTAGVVLEAQAWTLALGALLRNEPNAAAALGQLLEVMKYPTAAGRPTRLLLTEIKQRFPDAPEPSALPAATVAWARKQYPQLDDSLHRPPLKPDGRASATIQVARAAVTD